MNYLLVAPSFPPFSGVGAMRSYSLANYLQDKGHNVFVIRNSSKSWGEENCKSVCNSFAQIIDVDICCNFWEAARIYTKVISDFLVKQKIDTIIYSCSPYYIACSAVEIKEKFGIKTVIDFRDLWINDEFYTRNIAKRVLKLLKKIPYLRAEYEAIKCADLVLTVTPLDCKALKKQYKKFSKKIECVLNGYDEKRIKESAIKYTGKLPLNYIAVFGKFGHYDLYYAIQLLKAVNKYNEEHTEQIKIVHIGKEDKVTRKALKLTNTTRETYINLGYQEYALGIDIIKKAKANCLIAHYSRGLGTKIFDYIYADRPVIYFVPKKSSINEILCKGENAYLCNEYQDALYALERIFNEKCEKLGMDRPEQYSREERNKEYVILMGGR